jgi:hypothetical protein
MVAITCFEENIPLSCDAHVDAYVATIQRKFIAQGATEFLEFTFDAFIDDILHSWREIFSSVKDMLSERSTQLLKILESFSLWVIQLGRCSTTVDAILCTLQFLTSYSVKPLSVSVSDFIKSIYSSLQNHINAQSIGMREFGKFLDISKMLTGEYEQFLESKFVLNLKKMFRYMLSFSVLSSLGIDFDSFNYSDFEREAIKREFTLGPNFFKHVMEFIIFVGDRALSCYRIGSLSPMFSSSLGLVQWQEKAAELVSKFEIIDDSDIVFDVYLFRTELEQCLADGKHLLNYNREICSFDKKLISGIMSKLQDIKAKDLTIKACCKMRQAPFSLLIHGKSGIGKSVLTSSLFHYFATNNNLQSSDEYVYSRQGSTAFWNNFKSHMWGLLVDEIGSVKPTAINGIDPSLLEILGIINNAPFLPDQAALEDKGKTPAQFKLVLATTNRMDMHVDAYFSCPFAIMRRFPFAIDLHVKEYFQTSEGQLDSAKATQWSEDNPGVYQDFWDFHIYKPVPMSENRGIWKEIIVFKFINDFLQWFAFESIKHREIQESIIQKKNSMKEIPICESCHLPGSACDCVIRNGCEKVCTVCHMFDIKCGCIKTTIGIIPQGCEFKDHRDSPYDSYSYRSDYYDSEPTPEPIVYTNSEVRYDWKSKTCVYLLLLFSNFYWLGILGVASFCKFFRIRFNCYQEMKIFGIVLNIPSQFARFALRLAGIKFRIIAGDFWDKHKKTISIGIFIGSVSTLIILFYKYYNKKPKESSPQAQGTSASIGVRPEPNNEGKPNIWFNDAYQIVQSDLGPKCVGMGGLSYDDAISLLQRNCFDMEIYTKEKTLRNRALCLGGHLYVTNFHTLHLAPEVFQVALYSHSYNEGVSATRKVTLNKRCMYMIPDRDLVFFSIMDCPPRKDISGNFCKKSFNGCYKAYLLGVSKGGSIQHLTIHNYRKKVVPWEVLQPKQEMLAWCGTPMSQTKQGDCGAVVYSQTAKRLVIFGIHCGASVDGNIAVTAPIYSEDIDIANALIGKRMFSPSEPLISSDEVKRKLGSLHLKSPVRFIEHQGSAEVYGTFEGFCPSGKSKVIPTPIRDQIIDLGYQLKVGRPVLSGWVPKRTALLAMTNLPSKFDPYILNIVKNQFLEDIMIKLPKDELKILQVYDNHTAINGALGIAYVDKLKTSTSAGLPWRCQKTKLMSNDEPNNIEFSEDVMNRVDYIIENYLDHKLAAPLFCAQLKDEPVSFRKIKIGKTRVFCGAPLDFSIVVRKYFLSFVRLVQRNKYSFESAPGIICQSKEWQELAGYLTQHGFTTIIEGDFTEYDKTMAGSVLMAAFYVIIQIHVRAGASDEDTLVREGIAEDTSYPWIDFFGDLMRFFGTVASGHPLTVILNSFCNSIIM